MAIRMIPFPPSRNIAIVFWDDETLELTVDFQKGGRVTYYQVDETTANGFWQSLSATQYLNTFIVGVFPEQRMW